MILRRWFGTLGLIALVMGAFSSRASATAVVSLTASTPCPAINGNGGDWCQANGGPAFNLSSFTTESIGPAGTIGSAGFFAIYNNTGTDVTSLTLDFVGTVTIPAPEAQCGGGSTGIQGSGPTPTSGNAGCSITLNSGGFAVSWTNIIWDNKTTFDLQVSSFSAIGTQGVFEGSVPVPEGGNMVDFLGIGLVFVGVGILTRWHHAQV